ncbi:MAG: FAD-binding protein [Spirochaetota bacterium]
MKLFGKTIAVDTHGYDALIIGSGAAAYNCAVHLYDLGVTDIAIVTEGRRMGTSRNTGSDKQTYYKISVGGTADDSARRMAETLFAGGAMDGDTALCEASQSLAEFFHLTSIGVRFPFNRFGEYAGYKTDHDPRERASSIGPYTSKVMTECLERETAKRKIRIIDHTRVIKLLTDARSNTAFGVLSLKKKTAPTVHCAKNIVFATGGPAGMYANSVYPLSQFGASGVLAAEGVRFQNMSEWQYGLGSTKFRWNLSGSYQQVMPRYVSIDASGTEREFLNNYFDSVEALSEAIFLKGYQWPFDAKKITDRGSSTIDIAVYIERHVRGREVYLDFMKDPSGDDRIGKFSISRIGSLAHDYLAKSDALGVTPLARLKALNPRSYELYRDHHIDLAKDYLAMDVLAQHHNGGVAVDHWWRTSLKHLFAVGECAGTHGVYRPGGAALNAGQVGGLRAASFIAGTIKNDNPVLKKRTSISELIKKNIAALKVSGSMGFDASIAIDIQKKNSLYLSFIRSRSEIGSHLSELAAKERTLLDTKVSPENAYAYFRTRELIALSRMLAASIIEYMDNGGVSRSGYVLVNDRTRIHDVLAESAKPDPRADTVQETSYGSEINVSTRPRRPIPEANAWFESVWREFDNGTVFQ